MCVCERENLFLWGLLDHQSTSSPYVWLGVTVCGNTTQLFPSSSRITFHCSKLNYRDRSASLRTCKTVEPPLLEADPFREFAGYVSIEVLAWSMNYVMDYRATRTIHHATFLYSPQSNKQLLSSIDLCWLWTVMSWWVSNLNLCIIKIWIHCEA